MARHAVTNERVSPDRGSSESTPRVYEFALSFDGIVVTTFTFGTQVTSPIWILDHFRQPDQQPIVKVAAVFLILLSTIPVYLAQRLL